MKKRIISALMMTLPLLMLAQGWPANYDGVMLQGFYWDSFNETRWTRLQSQADELSEFFKLVWIPQSADCGGTSMGYDDLYWFTNYNSSFGTESQLRSMINTFKEKGIGTIADVVVNHRKSNNGWFGFPSEVYKGVTYSMSSTDVCSTDDGGKAKAEANRLGVQLGNPDTGEDWDGMRDLDHTSQNVQKCVKAYVKMLLEDLGYIGFRYDMVKGYSAYYTGMYNAHSGTEFSVGEYWDGNQTAVKNWLEGTKVDGAIQSAAFDFPFRYVIRDAVNNNRWTNLGTSTNKGLNMENNYKRYSVTFVENHDTQYRDANNQQDPIRTNIEAANAYMLAMPGTPCIFLKHWQDYKESIKQMIYVRQLAGVSNTSASYNLANSQGANYYVQRTVGNKGVILAAMGNTSYTIPATYVLVVSGNNYRLALSKSTETAWASKPSGTYDGAFNVTLTAVSQTEGAQLVYTLNGSEPTASNGTIVADGSSINISGSTTLKVGLLTGGAVSGVITRHYEIDDTPFVPFEITVYLKDPTVAPNNWSQVNFFSWDDTSSPNGSWPGQTITQTKVINGVKFYYHNYTIKNKDYYVNFVFNQGGSTASNHQTEDVTYVNKTSFFEVTTQTNKYQVADVTDTYLPYLDGGVTGDVNGDGEVSIADVNMLINMILSGTPQPSGDVNDDGEINIADVNAVIDIILNAA
jgi:alpha-amylase